MQTTTETSARYDFIVAKNTTFSEAVQFGDEGDTTWNLLNKTFRMGLKGNYEQNDETITFTSAAGEILVADAALRILVFNVPHTTMQAALFPGTYLYDLIMTDTLNSVRTQLIHGEFYYAEAVTED